MHPNIHEHCTKNLLAFWQAMAASEPASIVDAPDSLRITTGLALPLFNPIFIKPTADRLPTIPPGSNHSFWYDHHRNKNIPIECTESFEPIMRNIPVMSIQLDNEFKQENAPAIEINIIEDNKNLSEWIKPVQIAFHLDDAATLRYRHCLENMKAKLVNFIATSKGQVIASGSVFFHDEMAGLYNLAVLPEFRKQGIGTAMHYARLNEARKRGYAFATLQATPMAAALDASLGFKTESELSIFQC